MKNNKLQSKDKKQVLDFSVIVCCYNPDFEKEFSGGKRHCVTLIKDFEGEITAYFDEDNSLHFIGIGNKTFFTA